MHQSGHCAGAQHADRAVLLLEGDDAAGAWGRGSFSCGYCTVTAGFSIVLNVTPRPLIRPGSSACGHQNTTFKTPVTMMFSERERDQVLPGERLQLVLTEPRIGEAHPEDEEGDDHHLGEQHERPEDVRRPVPCDTTGAHQPPRNSVAAMAAKANAVPNSPMKKSRKRKPVYSAM